MDAQTQGQMEHHGQMKRPKMAIIDSNMLAVLGLKQILENVVPIMDVHDFGSFEEFEEAGPDNFVHFFVAQNIVLSHLKFFKSNVHRTLVMSPSDDPNSQLSGFHCICVNQPESDLIKQILRIMQSGHRGGKNLPPMPAVLHNKILSNREIEVLSLVVQGYINKEIADKLNIGLSTVVTHRKNITDKLGLKSVSALTIYAVMHGYVDINQI